MWESDKILEEQERQRRARWEQRHRRRRKSAPKPRRPLSYRIRQTDTYKSWRNLVLVSAAGKCSYCRTKDQDLKATHVVPMIQMCKEYHARTVGEVKKIREMWESRNGLALCQECLYQKCIADAVKYGWDIERTKKWFRREYPKESTLGKIPPPRGNRLESLEELQRLRG